MKCARKEKFQRALTGTGSAWNTRQVDGGLTPAPESSPLGCIGVRSGPASEFAPMPRAYKSGRAYLPGAFRRANQPDRLASPQIRAHRVCDRDAKSVPFASRSKSGALVRAITSSQDAAEGKIEIIVRVPERTRAKVGVGPAILPVRGRRTRVDWWSRFWGRGEAES